MKKSIPFYKQRFIFLALSLLAAAGMYTWTYIQGGFKLGIDFQPGISIVTEVIGGEQTTVAEALAGGDYSFGVQSSGGEERDEFVLRAPIPNSQEDQLDEMRLAAETALKAKFGDDKVTTLAVDYIGPSLSADLVVQTVTLIMVVLLLMGVYITFRFRLGYALSAVLCLVHDVVLTIGFIGAMQIELSTAVVAALLTLIGYSINDTIVVFDRIRENIKLRREDTFPSIIDASITETISRTLVTSLTTLLVVAVLAYVTDGDVKSFSLALLFGIAVGTYSSVAIASPLLPGFKSVRRDVQKEQESYVKAQAKA